RGLPARGRRRGRHPGGQDRPRHRPRVGPALREQDRGREDRRLERPGGRVRVRRVLGRHARRRAGPRGRDGERRVHHRRRRRLGRGRAHPRLRRGRVQPHLDRRRREPRVPGGQGPARDLRPRGLTPLPYPSRSAPLLRGGAGPTERRRTVANTRAPLMAGNWKMNLDHHQATHTVQKLAWTLKDAKHDYAAVEVAVLPPFTDLRSVQTLVDADKLELKYGAQDVSAHAEGAYTGEISAT